MAASAKEKFDAAVKVIHSLPKNGAFQPSNEMKLQFYAYYKQATQGPCNVPRPSFWDVVGKAKWEAWNSLGSMPSEKAMVNYVEELKKIIEAMPHTEMVSDFVEKLGNFYELVDEADVRKVKERASAEKLRSKLQNGRLSESRTDDATNISEDLSELTPVKGLHESDISLESDESAEDMITVHCVNHVESNGSLLQENIPVQVKSSVPSSQQNGKGTVTNGNGFQHLNGDHDSESEGEEFCDTSDLIQNSPPGAESILSETEVLIQKLKSQASSKDPKGDAKDDDVDAISERLGLPDADVVSSRGGGDDGTEGRGSTLQRWGSSTSMGSGHARGSASREPGGSRQGQSSRSGGAGGSDRDPPSYPVSRAEVTEQIAVALVRLQQDMNSVLTRLQTLEALSIAQHQLSRSRSSSEGERQDHKPWWWPFGNLPAKTVFAIVVWPFLVQWLLSILARRRNRKSPVSWDLGFTLQPFKISPGISIFLPVHPLCRLRKQ